MPGFNHLVPGLRAGGRLLGCTLLVAAPLALPLGWSAPNAETTAGGLRLHRTWMPEAYPSSFAVGFPEGLNVCFDPVRCNVIYAWRGNFVDLAPTVAGKIPRNAVVQGTVVSRDTVKSRFKVGDSDADIQFRGYTVKHGVPEFRYEVAGIEVREAVAPTPEGRALVRRFRVSTGNEDAAYRIPDGAQLAIEAGPARSFMGGLHLPAKSSITFSVTMTVP